MTTEEATEVCLETALRFACVSNLDITPILSEANRARLNTNLLLKRMDDRQTKKNNVTGLRARLLLEGKSVPTITITKPSTDDLQLSIPQPDEPIHWTLSMLCANSEHRQNWYPLMCTPDSSFDGSEDSRGRKTEDEIRSYFDLVESRSGQKLQKFKSESRRWVRFKVPYWHPDYPYDVWKRRRSPPGISSVIQLLKVNLVNENKLNVRSGSSRGAPDLDNHC